MVKPEMDHAGRTRQTELTTGAKSLARLTAADHEEVDGAS